MRIRHLAIGTVALVGVLAFAHDSWELTGTAVLKTARRNARRHARTGRSVMGRSTHSRRRLPDGRTDVEWRTSAATIASSVCTRADGQRCGSSPVLNRVVGLDNEQSKDPHRQAVINGGREGPRDGEVSYWLEDANAKGQRRWHGPLGSLRGIGDSSTGLTWGSHPPAQSG
jgi:hypothetical protein